MLIQNLNRIDWVRGRIDGPGNIGFSQILYDANERVEIRRKSSFRLESRTRGSVPLG
jgi:hypothetical protein